MSALGSVSLFRQDQGHEDVRICGKTRWCPQPRCLQPSSAGVATFGRDVSDAVEDNRRVFHYTSGTGLIGIIRSRCLWATQIQYLNDEREYLLAFDWARSIPESISVVREGEARRYPEFTAAIEERLLPLAQHFQRGRKPAIFVSSFSTQEDDLSQWRSYGSVGDAYAIGFRCSELAQLASDQGWRFARCLYDYTDYHQPVLDAVRAAYAEFEAMRPQGEEAAIDAALGGLVGGLIELSALAKDAAFRAEAEWRLISPQIPDTGNMFEYRVEQSTLIPYVSFPLAPADSPVPIRSVMVGPGPNQDLALEAAMSLTIQYGVYAGFGRATGRFRRL